MLYTLAHTDPNKSRFRESLGHSPLEGISTPFPVGTTDYVWDNLFSSAVATIAPWVGASHTERLQNEEGLICCC